ncbi:thioredoxin domain-containing protein [Candidatus Cyanaurora vandensis]|uniref:DsbA family protein n=1 Tax=Candidatus Cyanaurora vandensis TaxID=2714958 RepID=UPI00257E8523|nr:thioredoxin domain-containing protein [Candidatus Cyanaurora vandensis]
MDTKILAALGGACLILTACSQATVELTRPTDSAAAQATNATLPASQRAQLERDVRQALARPAVVALGNSPSKGPKNAPLTLVEFSDFQCPYCSRARDEFIKPFFNRYPGKVRLVYKNFPLKMHEHAYGAARASWAAGQQGKFFEYHDQLFNRQASLGEATFVDIARKLKLNEARFNQDRKSTAADQSVKADLAQGEAIKLRGTPTFVLNGVIIQAGTPLSVVDVVVDVLKKDKGLKV